MEHDLPPLIVMLAFSVVGIVAILVRHQQRMAMILHGRANPIELEQEQRKSLALTLYGPQGEAASGRNVEARLESLERQVLELKDLVHQQTLMLDSLAHPNQGVQEIRQRSES